MCEADPSTGLLLEPDGGETGFGISPWSGDGVGTRGVDPCPVGIEIASGTFEVVSIRAEVAAEETTEVMVLVTVDTVKVVSMLVLPPVVMVLVTGQVVT